MFLIQGLYCGYFPCHRNLLPPTNKIYRWLNLDPYNMESDFLSKKFENNVYGLVYNKMLDEHDLFVASQVSHLLELYLNTFEFL